MIDVAVTRFLCVVAMVKSSAYDVMRVKGVWGCGRSAVYRLNRVGESMVPWGTPFLILIVRDLWPFCCIWAVLPDRKLASHFLVFVGMLDWRILWIRLCLGTVSKALFMSIAINIVL